mmetsp:Transcript_10382/g.30804  ORF Transcript_10382/g.30804 Transcript_10382/m.30804 type:complete len:361 (-) Transcript_10382:486-1568(-)
MAIASRKSHYRECALLIHTSEKIPWSSMMMRPRAVMKNPMEEAEPHAPNVSSTMKRPEVRLWVWQRFPELCTGVEHAPYGACRKDLHALLHAIREAFRGQGALVDAEPPVQIPEAAPLVAAAQAGGVRHICVLFRFAVESPPPRGAEEEASPRLVRPAVGGGHALAEVRALEAAEGAVPLPRAVCVLGALAPLAVMTRRRGRRPGLAAGVLGVGAAVEPRGNALELQSRPAGPHLLLADAHHLCGAPEPVRNAHCTPAQAVAQAAIRGCWCRHHALVPSVGGLLARERGFRHGGAPVYFPHAAVCVAAALVLPKGACPLRVPASSPLREASFPAPALVPPPPVEVARGRAAGEHDDNKAN